MAVGAGSIRRAAKANAEAVKSVEVKETETTIGVEETQEVKKDVAAKKTTAAKKAPVKKVTNKKPSATPKKEVVSKKNLNQEKASGSKEQERTMNQVCHITEELPIHLL